MKIWGRKTADRLLGTFLAAATLLPAGANACTAPNFSLDTYFAPGGQSDNPGVGRTAVKVRILSIQELAAGDMVSFLWWAVRDPLAILAPVGMVAPAKVLTGDMSGRIVSLAPFSGPSVSMVTGLDQPGGGGCWQPPLPPDGEGTVVGFLDYSLLLGTRIIPRPFVSGKHDFKW